MPEKLMSSIGKSDLQNICHCPSNFLHKHRAPILKIMKLKLKELSA
jgi:hypothetical protein